MTYDRNNVFARILRGELPCKKVFENDYSLAFYDLYPEAKIHILVIPKGDFENFYDFHQNASLDQIDCFYKSVYHVINLLNLKDNGFKLVTRCGRDGGQEIPHYHVHLLGGQRVD